MKYVSLILDKDGLRIEPYKKGKGEKAIITKGGDLIVKSKVNNRTCRERGNSNNKRTL
jgi:hypothetical protein